MCLCVIQIGSRDRPADSMTTTSSTQRQQQCQLAGTKRGSSGSSTSDEKCWSWLSRGESCAPGTPTTTTTATDEEEGRKRRRCAVVADDTASALSTVDAHARDRDVRELETAVAESPPVRSPDDLLDEARAMVSNLAKEISFGWTVDSLALVVSRARSVWITFPKESFIPLVFDAWTHIIATSNPFATADVDVLNQDNRWFADAFGRGIGRRLASAFPARRRGEKQAPMASWMSNLRYLPQEFARRLATTVAQSRGSPLASLHGPFIRFELELGAVDLRKGLRRLRLCDWTRRAWRTYFFFTAERKFNDGAPKRFPDDLLTTMFEGTDEEIVRLSSRSLGQFAMGYAWGGASSAFEVCQRSDNPNERIVVANASWMNSHIEECATAHLRRRNSVFLGEVAVTWKRGSQFELPGPPESDRAVAEKMAAKMKKWGCVDFRETLGQFLFCKGNL